MCGINGIINKGNDFVDQNLIDQMNELLKHRGPDDSGIFVSDSIGFGHRRLSILDLSSKGKQPMTNDGLTITFNGEIYNYIELRQSLVEKGYEFHSNTDTEVILKAYREWGQNCISKFNGMWAFAIHDKNENIVFCSRDRFGIKPFYFFNNDSSFIFSSEIKPLLIHFKNNYVNKNILIEYLLYGLEEHTDETFFEDIIKLTPGHNLVYNLNNNKISINQYYFIQKTKNELSNDQNTEQIRKRLTESIQLRLRSDIKVGSCLSGGIDSSLISAIASKLDSKFNYNIHGKSFEGKYDESHFAKQVTDRYETELSIVEPSMEDFHTDLEKVVRIQEEPFGGPSIVMQYFVMKKSKEDNCSVLLDGQGADELFLGYETYYPHYLSSLLLKFNLITFFKSLSTLNFFQTNKLKTFFQSFFILFKRSLLFFQIKYKARKFVVKPNVKRLKKTLIHKDWFTFKKNQLTVNNLSHLLRYEDKNSMHFSIETRLPYLDYLLVEDVINLPIELNYSNGFTKHLLRNVAKSDLPKSIVWRKDKFGFEAPRSPFAGENELKMISKIEKSSLIKKIINIDKNTFNNKSFLWKLYCVSVWEDIFDIRIKSV